MEPFKQVDSITCGCHGFDRWTSTRSLLTQGFLDTVSRGFTGPLNGVLDNQAVAPKLHAQLKDALGHLHLSALMNLSEANHGNRCKGTTGFIQDTCRACALNIFRGQALLCLSASGPAIGSGAGGFALARTSRARMTEQLGSIHSVLEQL